MKMRECANEQVREHVCLQQYPRSVDLVDLKVTTRVQVRVVAPTKD